MEFSALRNTESALIKSELKIDDVHITQVGAKTRLCLLGLLARADIYYGNVNSGKYKDSLHLLPETTLSTEGHIKDGWTRDMSAGVTYLLFNNPLFQVGPSGGYSQNVQSYKLKEKGLIKNAKVTYYNKWQGPYAGIDVACQISCLQLRAGYSFHKAQWHGSLKGDPLDHTPKGSHASNARGKVIYGEALWTFCQVFTLGAEVKWQTWYVHKGKIKLRDLAEGKEKFKPKKKAKEGDWNSLYAALELGCTF